MFIIAPIIKIIITDVDIFAIMLIVIHLGINPERGGKPLNDNNRIGIDILWIGEWVIILFNLFELVMFLICIIRNIGQIIIVYIRKYTIVAIGLVREINLIIHPMWVIDEYAIIVRRWDWLIPIRPPVIALSPAINSINITNELVNMKLIIISGAIFCHVDKISADIHEIDVITDGYHIWHGAIPILRIRAININVDINWFGALDEDHKDSLLISRTLDPSACTKKYLTAASVSWDFLEYMIIGINLNKLISRAAQRNIQLDLEIAISVLITMIEDDKIKKGEVIKMWRSWTP